jgi:hypothetical protein
MNRLTSQRNAWLATAKVGDFYQDWLLGVPGKVYMITAMGPTWTQATTNFEFVYEI